MKIDRATDSYCGGSGRESFSGDLFRVVHWSMNGGSKSKTTVEFKSMRSLAEIDFDGIIEFTSDEDCMEQFSPLEIIEMMDQQRYIHFSAGESSKLRDIRSALGL